MTIPVGIRESKPSVLKLSNHHYNYCVHDCAYSHNYGDAGFRLSFRLPVELVTSTAQVALGGGVELLTLSCTIHTSARNGVTSNLRINTWLHVTTRHLILSCVRSASGALNQGRALNYKNVFLEPQQKPNLSMFFGQHALQFYSTCLKLLWTSPKSIEHSNFFTMLAHRAGDWWNLLARQKHLLAPGHRS